MSWARICRKVRPSGASRYLCQSRDWVVLFAVGIERSLQAHEQFGGKRRMSSFNSVTRLASYVIHYDPAFSWASVRC